MSGRQNLNIASVLAYMAPRYGGPPYVAMALGRELDKLGCGVSFYATGTAGDRQEINENSLKINLYETVRPKAWFRAPRLIENLSDETGSIDIIHLHEVWSYPQYASARLARRKGLPYVLTPHGELEPWRVRSKGLKKRLYLNVLGRRMLNGAACLHAISPREIDGFRRIGYKGPVAVIANGIRAEEFANLPEPYEAERKWPELAGRRVVLFLSRLSREKGLDKLLEAWAVIIKRGSYDDAILVIAGPDHRRYRRVVERLVEGYNLDSSVMLTGMVQDRDKAMLISRADIYTLPSYSEGFSISILENMAAGKPVLITPGCNFPEVSGAGAGLCVAVERDALAGALCKLLDMSGKEREAMGRRGQKLVRENYTWDIAARKMLSVYQCILENKEIPLYPGADRLPEEI